MKGFLSKVQKRESACVPREEIQITGPVSIITNRTCISAPGVETTHQADVSREHSMDNALPTSCIEIISSLHGQQQRRERNIDKKDLQAAIKYGTKEPTYNSRSGTRYAGDLRWKYDFAEVTYITDSTSTIEITSYPHPLPLHEAIIDSSMQRQEIEQKRRISTGLKITSHIVLVVDQSGSMNKSDVPGHRTRSRAVYYNIANEIISAPLLKGRSSFTDVVTLIEMGNESSVHPDIYREPISWALYNKIVALANDNFSGKSHGNYSPALDRAYDILSESSDENTALMLFFLSDGKPSDHYTHVDRIHGSPDEIRESYVQQIITKVRTISIRFKSRLTFGCFGFASTLGDFTVLQEMVSTAKQSGVKQSFYQHSIDSVGLRGLLCTLVTSLTETRTMLSSMIPNAFDTSKLRRPGLVREVVTPAKEFGGNLFDKSEWDFYERWNNIERKELYNKSFYSRGSQTGLYKTVPFHSPSAVGIAIKKTYFGEGAERIVFEMTEIDDGRNPVGDPLVVKINPWVEDVGYDQLLFHTQFGRTQKEASRLAKKFNLSLDSRNVPKEIPRIKYLDCTYYTARINGYEQGWLVEKRLDNTRFMKWSDNKGGIHNVTQGNTNAIEQVTAFVENNYLDIIVEGEEEEEEEEEELEDNNVKSEKGHVNSCSAIVDESYRLLLDSILPDDVPHAFSHWSFVYSKRDRLVCDIQGVLKATYPPLYELTDPAIHSSTGGLFGKTDHGRRGVHNFFSTHKCSPVCEVLGLRR